MSDPLAPIGAGHTEVPDDVRDQLIPTYIATLSELYEAEEVNIARATLGRAPSTAELLDDHYLRDLHLAMFKDVWTWAGRYRQHDVNIGGVEWHEVPGRVRQLVEDARFWVDNATYAADELAARFHHGLVKVHAFVNGNGRHGRFAAEFLVESLGQRRFTWGRGRRVERAVLRAEYRDALQKMDRDPNDVADLVDFCRA